MTPCRQSRGFTLIEVMIALTILALSLGALLSVQSSSMRAASKARDVTIATLLARSKMIDVEQLLADEGFTDGEQSDKGDFSDEGHPKVQWEYTITEVELDLGGLDAMCGMFGGGDEDEATDCESMLGGFGGLLEGFTTNVANSVRAVELVVTWPEGKYKDSMTLRALVTREDLSATGGTTAPGTQTGTQPQTGTQTGTQPGTATGTGQTISPGATGLTGGGIR